MNIFNRLRFEANTIPRIEQQSLKKTFSNRLENSNFQTFWVYQVISWIIFWSLVPSFWIWPDFQMNQNLQNISRLKNSAIGQNGSQNNLVVVRRQVWKN